MTAYDWMSMARVYGKYILNEAFTNPEASDDEKEKLKQKHKLVNDLLDCFKLMTAHELTPQLLDQLKLNVTKTLKGWKKLAPDTEQDIIFHLMKHIPEQLERAGPARTVWMFHFERFFSFCTQAMHQRRHAEANLAAVWKRSFLTTGPITLDDIPGESHYVDQIIFPSTNHWRLKKIKTEHVHQMLLRATQDYFDLDAQWKEENRKRASRKKAQIQWRDYLAQSNTIYSSGLPSEACK